MSLTSFHRVTDTFFNRMGWSTTATLIKSSSTYDASTSENIVTEKRYTMQAIPLDYINKNEGATTNANTLIRSGDKQIFLAPNKLVKDIDPSADKIVLGGKTYKIITVKVMNPTMTDTLYYELFIRI